MSPREIVTKVHEIIGLSASLGGYRTDLPAEPDEVRYQELWVEVDTALQELREQGADLPNPNPHRRLAQMRAWIWAEGGSGKQRKERPSTLYSDLISKLQVVDLQMAPAPGATGAAALPTRLQLDKGLSQPFSSDDPLAVVFIDLDGFKRVNDRGGHQEGDRCLDEVVGVIQSVIRGRGHAFRYGGDEFAVVLTNVNLTEATATAERLRNAVAVAGSGFEVTASVGVACSDDPGVENGASLIAAADEAAYVSKFSGKNRTTVWPIDPAVRDEVSRRRQQAQGREPTD